jgi:membrane protein CcdC involved in cytochrome C biogenesis
MLWAIVGLLVAFTTIMQLRVRVQRLEFYWVEPLVLLVLCWIVIDEYVQWHFTAHYWYTIGTIVGIIIGLLRGRATEVELGKKPGTFTVEGSWITVFLLLLVTGTNIAAKAFLRSEAGVDVQRVTSPLILVTAFNIIAWRAVVLVKYLKLQRNLPANA